MMRLITSTRNFIENDLNVRRHAFEAEPPCLVLTRPLDTAKLKTALDVARSIDWPKEVTFGSIVIAHKADDVWRKDHRVALYRGP